MVLFTLELFLYDPIYSLGHSVLASPLDDLFRQANSFRATGGSFDIYKVNGQSIEGALDSYRQLDRMLIKFRQPTKFNVRC